MSTRFGAFVRSPVRSDVRSPLRVRNPSCGYFPGLARKFSITIVTQGGDFTSYPNPTTDSQRWHVTGDGYGALNLIGGENPYWVPTIALAPGLYRGTWSVNRAGEDLREFSLDSMGIECRFHPIYNVNDFDRHEQIDFRNWECFPNYPHAVRGYDTGATAIFGNSSEAVSLGYFRWPNGGTYEWLAGRTSSWYETQADRFVLPYSYDRSPGTVDWDSSPFRRWKCPGRIWININLTNYDSTFTLTGDSTPLVV